MIIILEGVDGTGKTTLAHELCDLAQQVTPGVNVTYLHAGPPDRHPLYEYEVPLQDVHPTRDLVVCDRWHLGELVYGPLYRGGSQLQGPGLRHIRLFLHRHGAVVVRLKEDIRTVTLRVSERGDTYVNVLDLDELDHRYDTQPVDVTYLGLVDYENKRRLLKWAQAQGEEVEPLLPFPSYVGSPAPSALLLGDRRGVDYRGHTSCFVPYEGTSGRYLLQHLDAVGENLGLANANEEDVLALWDALGQPPVVALGKEAEHVCDDAALDYATVPHPQYMRRFKHGQGKEYAEEILTLVRRGR
jgi:thymidylate kinase